LNTRIDTDRSFNYLLLTFSSGRNSMVECQLPKLEVAGSSPVARSRFHYTLALRARMCLAINTSPIPKYNRFCVGTLLSKPQAEGTALIQVCFRRETTLFRCQLSSMSSKRNTRVRVLTGAVCVVFATTWWTAASAQQQEKPPKPTASPTQPKLGTELDGPVIVNTDLITLTVTVTDTYGRYVSGMAVPLTL
jgi:hypothetical protein